MVSGVSRLPPLPQTPRNPSSFDRPEVRLCAIITVLVVDRLYVLSTKVEKYSAVRYNGNRTEKQMVDGATSKQQPPRPLK